MHFGKSDGSDYKSLWNTLSISPRAVCQRPEYSKTDTWEENEIQHNFHWSLRRSLSSLSYTSKVKKLLLEWGFWLLQNPATSGQKSKNKTSQTSHCTALLVEKGVRSAWQYNQIVVVSRCVVSHSAFRMEFDPFGIANVSSATAGCSPVPICPQWDRKNKALLPALLALGREQQFSWAQRISYRSVSKLAQ